LIRRAPLDSRESLLRRYKQFDIEFPSTSFLRTVEQRLEAHSAAGQHKVKVCLARRNHKSVDPEDLKAEHRGLYRLLVEFELAHCRTHQFTENTGLSLNGFPVQVGKWFGYDADTHNNVETKVGCIEAAFACTFGDVYHCFVELRTWTYDTKPVNKTDYTVIESSKVYTIKTIPVKCLCSAFFKVSHWDPVMHPGKSCLLFIQNL
jgi:hypothetical protein